MVDRIQRTIDVCSQSPLLLRKVDELRALQEKAIRQELTISVIGQFKRGKTSLVNAILGCDILPVGIVPLTTVVTEIRQGDEFSAAVCFSDGRNQQVTADELDDYISERGNRGNAKNVSVVKLQVDSYPFGSGVTLVDTPGVGSLNKHNTEASYSYTEKSDAVLFLLSVDSPISETERNFLLKAKDEAAAFFFVVNKIDTISGDALSEYLEYCSQMLSELMEGVIELFPISVKEGTGIQELVQRIRDSLDQSHTAVIESSAEIKLERIIRQAETLLELELASRQMPLDALSEKLTVLQDALKKSGSLSDEAKLLSKRDTDELVAGISRELDLELEANLATLNAQAEKLRASLSALPPRQFETQFSHELEECERSLILDMNESGLELLDEGYAAICARLENSSVDLATTLSALLNSEFGLSYDFEPIRLSVSDRTDFHVNLAKSGTFLFDSNDLLHLGPKKWANERLADKITAFAASKLEANKNNIVSGYRYKMQESLRTLCNEYGKFVDTINAEFAEIGSALEARLSQTDQESADDLNRDRNVLRLLREI